jgi:hypothetical protein
VTLRLIGLVLALGLTLAPLAAEAQQARKVYRIGYLSGALLVANKPFLRSFSKDCGSSAMRRSECRNQVSMGRWEAGTSAGLQPT